MVKKPNGVAKATASSAGVVAGPSKANPSTPGSFKNSKFKRKVKANRLKAEATAAAIDKGNSVGAGTAGGDASAVLPQSSHVAEAAIDKGNSVGTGTAGGDASAVLPQLSHVAEASPVAQMPKSDTVAEASPVAHTAKPVTDAEGSEPALKPAIAEASALKSEPADNAAAATASKGRSRSRGKGKGVGADNSSRDGRMKSRKERARNGKGKEEDGGSNGKGKKGGKEDERGDNKGAGFIFMCNAKTKQDCYQNRLFGLPGGKIGMVKKIRPGAKLFLYDFDLKLLYGVYKAASHGGLNLVPDVFDGKFPAQVKFKIDKDCLPLPESSIKQGIKENYSARSKFDPELTATQVRRLLTLFKPINILQSASNNRREERRHYEERRQPYHFEERRPSLHIEEMCQARFVEERHPAVPLEDPYRAPRFAPLSVESQLNHSLAMGDHHRYYQPALAPEPQHITLALERHYVPSVPELRHVPAAYYNTSAPSGDSYYRSVENLAPERYAERTVARDTIIPRITQNCQLRYLPVQTTRRISIGLGAVLLVVHLWRSSTLEARLMIVWGSPLELTIWKTSIVLTDLLPVPWTPCLVQPIIELLTRLNLLMLKQAQGLSLQGSMDVVPQFRHSIPLLVGQRTSDE